MRRIRERVEETHRQCIDATRDERGGGIHQCPFVERHERPAVGGYPFSHLGHPRGRDEWNRLLERDRIDVRTILALKQQEVVKAAGDQQSDAAALSFEDGVGRDGRRVEELNDARQPLADRLLEAVDHALRRISRRRWNLVGVDRSGLVEPHEIGEGPTNLNGDSDAGTHVSITPARPTRHAAGQGWRQTAHMRARREAPTARIPCSSRAPGIGTALRPRRTGTVFPGRRRLDRSRGRSAR